MALLGLALLGWPGAGSAAAGRTVKQVLDEVDSAVAAPHPPGYATVEQALASAYGVPSASELRGRVSLALLYRTSATGPVTAFVYPAQQHAQPAASAIKVVLAVRAALDVADSKDWSKPIGKSTLGATVHTMIAESNNAAANRLLDRYSLERINSWVAGLGFTPDELHFGRRFGDFSPAAMQNDNTCSALGLAKFYFLLDQGGGLSDFAPAGAVGKVRSLLDSAGAVNHNAAYNDRLNAKLPGVHFQHKTGSNPDVLVDGGIVLTANGSYVLVVIDETKDRPAMQRLGASIYKLLTRPAA